MCRAPYILKMFIRLSDDLTENRANNVSYGGARNQRKKE